MTCHCFLRPIRRDLTSSSHTIGLSLGGRQGGSGGWGECSFSLKIRLLPIAASAIANNAVTIRYLIGRDEKTRGREKRKDSTRNFDGEYVETRCLGNERFLSSDEYCVKERNERKEETEKYHGVFYRIVGFTGKRFLFSPPPPPHSSFFCSLSLQLSLK